MAELFCTDRAFSFSVIDTVHQTFMTEPMPTFGNDGILLSLVTNTTED